MSDAELRAVAVRLAEAAASRPVRVILFGSRARDQARDDSDVDLLVVERSPGDRFAESARLNSVAGRMGVPADVVVVSEGHAEAWGEVPGTMLHDALSEGVVLARA